MGVPIEHPARSFWRLLAYGFLGWALCAATIGALLQLESLNVALVIHAIAAPVLFGTVAWRYFRARGARNPLPTALAWTALVVTLDIVVVAGFVKRDLSIFERLLGTWLPFVLIFLATWATGALMTTLPWTREGPTRRPASQGLRT
jgi:hypothetical protein